MISRQDAKIAKVRNENGAVEDCAVGEEESGCKPTYSPTFNLYSSGTSSSATMLMILISGLIAGPAVSL